jgi:hypothetical protein
VGRRYKGRVRLASDSQPRLYDVRRSYASCKLHDDDLTCGDVCAGVFLAHMLVRVTVASCLCRCVHTVCACMHARCALSIATLLLGKLHTAQKQLQQQQQQQQQPMTAGK